MTQRKPLQNWKFLIITEDLDVQGSDDEGYMDWLQSNSNEQVFEGKDYISECEFAEEYQEYLREQDEDEAEDED